MSKPQTQSLDEMFWEIVDANWDELELFVLTKTWKRIEDGEEEAFE